MKKDITHRIDEAMDSLNNVVRATPAPFLYTRVEARLLHNRHTVFWDKAGIAFSRPAIAFSGLALLIIINLFAVIEKNQKSTNPSYASIGTDQVSSEDYVMNASAFYDDEISEQP